MFVLFATPSLKSEVCLEFFESAIQTDWLLAQNGIDRGYKQVGGDPYLAKVRNRMATDALLDYPQMTDFFFLDDDIGWPAEAVLRLLQSPEPVVAGIYPKKNDALEFPCELEMRDCKLIERDGWYKARAVPTGFLRIKRHVLEQMAEKADRYPDMDGRGGSRETFNIFEMGYCTDDGKWWGEDYAFCQKWHRMGGEVWVDPNIMFTHRGGKKWGANFGDTVKAFEARLPEGGLAEAAE